MCLFNVKINLIKFIKKKTYTFGNKDTVID